MCIGAQHGGPLTVCLPSLRYCFNLLTLSALVTFGAATVLLASLLSSEEDTVTSVDTSLASAMDIFKHYINKVESSVRAIQVIEAMKHRLSQFRNTGILSTSSQHRTRTCSPSWSFFPNMPSFPGVPISHIESQHTEFPHSFSPQDSTFMFGSSVNYPEGHAQDLAPDLFTDDWFSNQMMAFDLQGHL